MTQGNIEIERDRKHFVMFRTTCDCGLNDYAVMVIVDPVGDVAAQRPSNTNTDSSAA